MNIYQEYEAALCAGGEANEAIIAEGLARGDLEAVNRISVSPGGLRFASREDLNWLDPAPDTGRWLLGTGFVAMKPEAWAWMEREIPPPMDLPDV
jgi:hypothetical protein